MESGFSVKSGSEHLHSGRLDSDKATKPANAGPPLCDLPRIVVEVETGRAGADSLAPAGATM